MQCSEPIRAASKEKFHAQTTIEFQVLGSVPTFLHQDAT
jgi:hypothetical protein